MAAAFTNVQNTNFFTNGPQMGLSATERLRLQGEGLVTVDDFIDFKEEQLKDGIKNLCISIPGIPAVLDPTSNVVAPAVPAVPPCLISARCSLRLKVASIAYHYYLDIGRTPTPQGMNYSQVLRGFYTEWEAMKQLSKEDRPDVPALSKQVTPVRWIESFKDCLYRTYGVRSCPISYVIRENPQVEAEILDPLVPGQAFGRSGSVTEELIQRLNHNGPLFRSDNALVYSLLDEATRNTIYAPTIKPFARTKNGRDAWLAIVSSHAGDDKWDQIRKDKYNFLMNTKWNGRAYSLEKFTGLHRSSFVMLEEASLHVPFQLPTEHSRVGYLLDNITSQDPDLRAALASIRANTNNMRNDFELAVAFILPVCPYIKYKSNNRQRPQAQISEVVLQGRELGVELRWHKPEEYSKLNKRQRQILWKWQQTKEGQKAKDEHNKKNRSKRQQEKKKLEARVNSLEKKLSPDEANDDKNDDGIPSIEEIQACIAAAYAQPNAQKLPPIPPKVPAKRPESDPFTIAATAVQQIVKRKRK